MWVFLDEDIIEANANDLDEGEKFIYEPYLNNMKESLSVLAEEISKIECNFHLD